MATLPIDSRVSSRTHDFVAQKHRMFIDGRFVFAASGKTFPVYNPATGEIMAYVPEADPKTSTAPSAPPAKPSTTAPGPA